MKLRRLLQILSVMTAVALLFSIYSISGAAPVFLNNDAYLNVRDYGAKGDGKTDDTKAIRAAVSAAKSGGKTVFFPAGLFLVTESIEVPAGVDLLGVTAATNGPYQNHADGESKGKTYNGVIASWNNVRVENICGTWIYCYNGLDAVDSGATFALRGDNSVRMLGFVNGGSTPVIGVSMKSPPVVGVDIDKLTSTKGILIEDISLGNPYYGIAVYQGSLASYNTGKKLSGKSSGPVTIRNVMGAAVYRGVYIAGANGKIEMDNIQFNYSNYATTYIKEHYNNCVDIDIAASTNVSVVNVLSFGAQTGFKTSSAFSGSPVNVTGSNLNLEGENPLVLAASGKQTISNSYLLLTNFASLSEKTNFNSITIKQDNACSTKPVYTIENIVIQSGESNNVCHVNAEVGSGASITFSNSLIWGWETRDTVPLFKFTHASGSGSTMTVANLGFMGGVGMLATTGGSAYKTGELTFKNCTMPASLYARMNTAAGAPVGFVNCTKENGGTRTKVNNV